MKESGEMYLESIYVLSENSTAVRSIDVAEHMGYSKPSVSRAMGILRAEGLVEVDGHGCITLTKKGAEVAKKIVERHRVLTALLCALGVDGEVAAADACRMEHVLSEQSFEAIKAHLEKYGTHDFGT